jgi:hypothetical protein
VIVTPTVRFSSSARLFHQLLELVLHAEDHRRRVGLAHLRLDHHPVTGTDAEEPGFVEVLRHRRQLSAADLQAFGALLQERLQVLFLRGQNRSRQAVA